MSSDQSRQSSILYAELKKEATQTFFFDDDDLSFNRDGKLSDKQKQRFRTASKKMLIIFVLLGFFLSVLAVFPSDKPARLSVWLIPILGMVSFSAIGIYFHQLGSKIYKSGIVACAIGAATFKSRLNNSSVQIGDKLFQSQGNLRKIFLPNIQYKVYYAPGDNTILSIEIAEQ